jgi:sugar O-acyltransferase (sialic acid O-acetyltransferase NeuD family)
VSSIVVIGAGGHGKVVVATALAAGFEVRAVIDSDSKTWGRDLLGVRVTGPDALSDGTAAVLAIGNNVTRRQLAHRHACRWTTVIHPNALVHPTARVGEGTVIFAGVIVQPDTIIGAHCILNTGASLDHDNTLGDFVHVAPGAHTAGNVTLEEGAFLGIGVSVIPGRRVGAWSTVGAGAAVVHDIPPNVTAVGVPARTI